MNWKLKLNNKEQKFCLKNLKPGFRSNIENGKELFPTRLQLPSYQKHPRFWSPLCFQRNSIFSICHYQKKFLRTPNQSKNQLIKNAKSLTVILPVNFYKKTFVSRPEMKNLKEEWMKVQRLLGSLMKHWQQPRLKKEQSRENSLNQIGRKWNLKNC